MSNSCWWLKKRFPLSSRSVAPVWTTRSRSPPPHIKEEQEELCVSQEGEQLQGLEEADITKFPFTPVPVKSEDDEEEAQSSQLHQRQTQHMETEADGEDCGGPEPARNSHPLLQPETEDTSDLETDDSADWKETGEPQSALNSLKHDLRHKKTFSCSECGRRFGTRRHLYDHMRIHPGEKKYSCSVCNKRFIWRQQVRRHKCVNLQSSQLQSQTEENREAESPASRETQHMETEADGEDCGGPEPARNSHPLLQPETEDQTGDCSEPETDDSADWKETREPQSETREPQSALNSLKHDSRCKKTFSCSECGKIFGFKSDFKRHMRTHTGEKPFSCSECGKAFTDSGNQKKHMRTHTGEKPFSCSVCKKSFTRIDGLRSHMTGDSADWKETREPQSALNSLKHDSRCKKTFSCSECGRRFNSESHLKRHVRTHTGEKPFSCSECGKAFAERVHLKEHMRTHTGEKPFSCSVCKKSFTQSGTLRSHMNIHTGEKSFSCLVCNKSFTQRGSLRVCDQSFTWYKQLRDHQCVGGQSQTEENREAAEDPETEADGEDCGGPEPHPQTLSQPETEDRSVSVNSMKYSCSQCGKGFNNSSSVDQQEPESPPHIKEEQEELCVSQEGEQLQGLEEADITKFPFTPVPVKSEDDEEEAQSSQLHQRQTQHMETEADGEDCGGPEPARNSHPLLEPETEDQTGDSSEPETDDSADWKETREPQSALNSLKHDSTCKKTFSCSECGNRFSTKPHLKRHMRIHTGEKPFSCLVCKKTFLTSRNLRLHMIIHTGEKPFSCSVCKKSFTQRGGLQTHMRTHTGEKPFSCSECGKAFTERGTLKNHMRTHTGEKPFSCSVCKKSFTQSGDLRSHMKTHTGEKPFSCSVCKKSFTRKGGLRSHMAIVHTGEKPFSCSVCKKSFTQRGHLQSHMVVHTGEKKFSCSVCNKRFAWRSHVKTHKCVGQMETEADGEDCGGPEPQDPLLIMYQHGSLFNTHWVHVLKNSGRLSIEGARAPHPSKFQKNKCILKQK
uniref:C2H2-type domain-containing protein n=1 Tax=Sander lucioperca TaxID=283035 RepID=A0A8C9XPX0_SANLU